MKLPGRPWAVKATSSSPRGRKRAGGEAAFTPSRPGRQDPRIASALYPALIALAVLLAYSDSFHGAFVYDDRDAILGNPTLQSLAAAWVPPANSTVSGRPVLNFSLALSHALSGSVPWGYHALNLLFHLLAALTLYGLLRRTLALHPLSSPSKPPLTLPGSVSTGLAPARGEPPARAAFLAFAIALLWAVHPLQTEAVTYIVQRAESLMGLFYLFTLYAFVRAYGDHAPRRPWAAVAVGSCLLGMATKEVMVTAPAVIVLYDRTFLAGSFLGAWRRRRAIHLSFAATWLLLAALIVSTGGNRGGTIGFGVGVPWWTYSLTQFHAITTYLALSLWPHPLIFDRGPMSVRAVADVLPYAIVVAAAVAATIYALRRRPALGFLGAAFFIILSPTSSIVPGTTQYIVEHRMYLPLAAILTLLVLGLARSAPVLLRRALIPAALGFALLTFARNPIYRTEAGIWAYTEAQVPDNPDTHGSLAALLLDQGNVAAAAAECRTALKLEPRIPEINTTLGNILLAEGRAAEAIAAFTTAIRLRPAYPVAHIDLGNAYEETGRLPEAVAEYRTGLRLAPTSVEAENNLGFALSAMGRSDEAIAWFASALKLNPGFAPAQYNWGLTCRRTARYDEALAHYAAALRLRPDYPAAALDLGTLLLQLGRLSEAQPILEGLVSVHPQFAEARNSLGVVYLRTGALRAAEAQFAAAVRLRPDYAPARRNLAYVTRALGAAE